MPVSHGHEYEMHQSVASKKIVCTVKKKHKLLLSHERVHATTVIKKIDLIPRLSQNNKTLLPVPNSSRKSTIGWLTLQ